MPFLQGRFLALEAFKQFIEVDRLLVVIGDARTQGLDHILLVGATGEHDRFERAMLAGDPLQRLDQLDAVHVRHMQVTQH